MKRYRTLFALTSLIGIVAVCTFGLTFVSSAQPNAQGNLRQNMPQDGRQTADNRPNRDFSPQGDMQGRQPGGNLGFGLNLAGIELSDEQKDQMRQQMRDFQVNTAEIRQKLQFAEQDLRQEMRNETVDQAAVESLWAEITNLKQQIGQAQVNHILALKGILTPEQLATIQENESTVIELQKLRLEERELLLASGAPDVQRLQQIQAEIAAKEVALERERVENRTERFANLTPEEQEQFRNKRDRMNQMQPRR